MLDAPRRAARGLRARGLRARSRILGTLPPPARRRLRNLRQRTRVRLGREEMVPAGEFEDFLTDQLQRVRAETGGARLRGDYLEFGVYVGTSLGAAVRAFDRAGCHPSRFFGFDSFAGLPEGSEADGWPSGAYASARSVAEWNLARQDVLHRVELVEGWFDATCTPDTAARHRLDEVLVAMVDCDTYSSSCRALDFVAPLLGRESVVIFDDWYSNNPDGTLMEGQRRACHEFLESAAPEFSAVCVGHPGFHGKAFRVSRAKPPIRDRSLPPPC